MNDPEPLLFQQLLIGPNHFLRSDLVGLYAKYQNMNIFIPCSHSGYTGNLLVMLQLSLLVNCQKRFTGIFEKVVFTHDLLPVTSKDCMWEMGLMKLNGVQNNHLSKLFPYADLLLKKHFLLL